MATMRPAIIGPFGPAQLACLRSWKARGWQPLFIQVGERRASSLLTGLLAGYLHLPADGDESSAMQSLARFLEDYDATGITCLSYDRMAWLAQIAPELPANLGLWVAPPEMLQILRSKTRQVEAALAVGLPVLDSLALDKQSAAPIPKRYFPLVLRPGDESDVRPPFKMTLAENDDAVTRFLTSRTYIGGALIGQRFVNGPNLVVHGMRNADGQHVHQAAFLANRKFNGVSLTIEPAALPGALGARCRAFVDKIDYVGIYHFELVVDRASEDVYFLEINGRLGGTTGKVYACGYDEPAHLVEAFCATGCPPAEYHRGQRHIVCSNKRSIARALLESLRGQRTLFDYHPGPSRWYIPSLVSGLFRWRDEIMSLGQFRTAMAYTLHTLLPNKPQATRNRGEPLRRR